MALVLENDRLLPSLLETPAVDITVNTGIEETSEDNTSVDRSVKRLDLILKQEDLLTSLLEAASDTITVDAEATEYFSEDDTRVV